MADALLIDVDAGDVQAALGAVCDAALGRVREADRATATDMLAEMRSRVARATGETAENIFASEYGTDGGFVVHTGDVRIDFGTGEADGYYRDRHVALWLEKGTRRGKPHSHASSPRPFFFASAALLQDTHSRRIGEALADAGEEVGLGG